MHTQAALLVRSDRTDTRFHHCISAPYPTHEQILLRGIAGYTVLGAVLRGIHRDCISHPILSREDGHLHQILNATLSAEWSTSTPYEALHVSSAALDFN